METHKYITGWRDIVVGGGACIWEMHGGGRQHACDYHHPRHSRNQFGANGMVSATNMVASASASFKHLIAVGCWW